MGEGDARVTEAIGKHGVGAMNERSRREEFGVCRSKQHGNREYVLQERDVKKDSSHQWWQELLS